MKEVWKALPKEIEQYKGYDHYQFSNLGRVRNKKTGIILKPGLDSNNYRRVSLLNNGKPLYIAVHVGVMMSHKPLKDKHGKAIPFNHLVKQVDHLDGEKENNSLKNLCWKTPGENTSDYYKRKRKGVVVPEIEGIKHTPLKGYEDKFEIYENGQIYSKTCKRFRKQKAYKKSRPNCSYVVLYHEKEGKYITYAIRKLLEEHFPENYKQTA